MRASSRLLQALRRGAEIVGSGSPSVEPHELAPLLEPLAGDETLAQRRPSAVRVGERVYVAWEHERPLGPTGSAEILMVRVEFDAGSGVITQDAEIALPLPAQPGIRHNPRLAATELFPEGAVLSVWESVAPGVRRAAELEIELRPSPFVMLPAATER